MKKTILFFTILLFCCQANAQINLVPNPSFGEYDSCPVLLGEIEKCKGWFNYGNSPDYFNECNSFSTIKDVKIPLNSIGVQYPASGKAYAGVITFTPSLNDYREYIACKLTNALAFGTKYYIAFKVSFGDSSKFSSNKIGVNFSTTNYDLWNPVTPANKCMVYTNQIITDTLNWLRINGSFIADSNYEYLILGNFFNDSLTQHTITNSTCLSAWAAYYFIDDVCLSTDSLYTLNYGFVGVNNITNNLSNLIYPNPAQNYINIRSTAFTTISIYNIIGEKIYSSKLNADNEIIDISMFGNGIYFINIKNQSLQLIQKMVVQK